MEKRGYSQDGGKENRVQGVGELTETDVGEIGSYQYYSKEDQYQAMI